MPRPASLRCVAYDRRGHGRSDVPAVGYDLDTLADDLACVIDTLLMEDVVLAGHSMAGAEGIRYLARYGSARVFKVALLAPATPFALLADDNPNGVPTQVFAATAEMAVTSRLGWRPTRRHSLLRRPRPSP